MMDKVTKLLKDGSIVLPRILLESYNDLGLSSDELLIVIYLLNNNDNSFNPQALSEALKIPLNKVLELINGLTEKQLMTIKVQKKGSIREEKYDFTSLYQKLVFRIIDEQEKKGEPEEQFFTVFEKELGRTISPMEYEIITTWLDNDYSKEIILLALKEAIFNGVSSLRYIDKILYEWKKKGLKTADDIELSRKNYNLEKEKPKKLFDYDWLNDNDK